MNDSIRVSRVYDQVNELLLKGRYDAMAYVCEQEILAGSTDRHFYHYLSLSQIINEEMEAAHATWLSYMINIEGSEVDRWQQDILSFLHYEAKRQKDFGNDRQSLLIFQALMSLDPESLISKAQIIHLQRHLNQLTIESCRDWIKQIRRQKKPIIVCRVLLAGTFEHFRRIFSHLMRKKSSVIFITDEPLFYEAEFSDNPNVVVIRAEDFRFFQIVPDALISLNPEHYLPIRSFLQGIHFPRILLQHGLSEKKVFGGKDAQLQTLADYNVIFLSGPIYKDSLKKQYVKKYPGSEQYFLTFDIGHPKVEDLFDGTWKTKEILLDLDLDLDKKTILYAPTWERLASLEMCGEDIVHALASMNYNLIVKLHHLSLVDSRQTGFEWLRRENLTGKNWREILKKIQEEYDNVRFIETMDASPYCVAADLLVSDYSGIAYEFVLQNQPVVFFDIPEFTDHYGTQGIQYWGRYCGEVVNSCDEMIQAVSRNLDFPKRKESERIHLINRIIYNKTSASKYAAIIIDDLIQGKINYPTCLSTSSVLNNQIFPLVTSDGLLDM